MRIVRLSDHPGDMLQDAQRRRDTTARREQDRYEATLARHRDRVSQERRARNLARAEHRWFAWLRAILAVRREQRQAPAAPPLARPFSHQEEILRAGVQGEHLAEAELDRALGDEWTLLRGYRNRRGEIDHLLLGPRGLVAIEGKHRNATVSCDGDRWWYVKYDKYGNAVDRGELADKRGRSPSQQLSQPAGQLEDFLRSRGHPVAVQRVVWFTHPRSRLADCTRPTVRIATTADQLIRLLNDSPAVITADECAQLERLIIRDHQFQARRRSR
jgi:hypothetical protein